MARESSIVHAARVDMIAEGRASEILDLGEGRVLRRFKAGGDPGREARVMEHVRARGYPVPRVHDVLDDGLVLDRVDGPTMAADLRRRPWSCPAHAALLAELHDRLHAIPAPRPLPALGHGDRTLHLDLHPENVILSRSGPVVIDWTNARAGEPPVDVAMTWVILATGAGLPGRLFLRFLLRHLDRGAAAAALPRAAELRLVDPNVTDPERASVRRLLAGRFA